jgi:hypothetical protein
MLTGGSCGIDPTGALVEYNISYLAKLVDESIDRRLLNSAMLKSALNSVLHSIGVLLAFVDTRLSMLFTSFFR